MMRAIAWAENVGDPSETGLSLAEPRGTGLQVGGRLEIC